MSSPVLSLQDASLSLQGNAGPVRILDAISLDVHRQETVGLIGPSGSGKSSLLMLMGGLEQATGGKVTALGHDLTTMTEDQLARLRRDHFGVVFQSFHLIPTMTALENVATPLELAGEPDAFARAEEELKTVGLESRMNHYPSQLSGGEQQRVALARAEKFIEAGGIEGHPKGSDTHKAAVVGDTVGDPFKDTSGPGVAILIKVMSVVSLLVAPLIATL